MGIVVFSCYGGSLTCVADEAWQALKEVDGIRVSSRNVPGTPLVEIRGEALVEASAPRVAWALMDCAHAHEWVEALADCHIVETRGDFDRFTYNHFATPFVIKDRDFVTHVRGEMDKGARTLTLRFKSEEHPNAPETKYVRGNVIRSSYVITWLSPTQSRLIAEALVDPKGTVPLWIVNFFQKKWPVRSIQALRKQVAKPEVQAPAFLNDRFADPVPPSAPAPSASPKKS